MGIGIMNRALDNVKKRKDTTPTLDAQVVDLPEGDKNEKQIAIQRPDNDDDKNVNLPAATGGNGLVPPNQPEVNVAALGGNGQLAPLGNRDVAEDVEFTVDKEEPEGIEGYKQAGESTWYTPEDKTEEEDKEEEQKKIEKDETPSLEDKSEKPEYEDVGTWKDPDLYGADEYEDVATWRDPDLFGDDDEDEKKTREKKLKRDKKLKKNSKKTGRGSDLLKSGATNFSINDIVEGEPEIPHYQYRSLLRR